MAFQWLRPGWIVPLLAMGTWMPGAEAAELAYTVIERDGDKELRNYAPRVVIEARVKGNLTEALAAGTGLLDAYVGTVNALRETWVMAEGTQRIVRRFMPADTVLADMPESKDPAVTVSQSAQMLYAAMNVASPSTRHQIMQLGQYIQKQTRTSVGMAIYVYYPQSAQGNAGREELLLAVTDAN